MAFTFGRRCSLCGGKLDNRLRCTECGLDNTKNDDMYKGLLNKSRCESKPLTHVHDESELRNYSTGKKQTGTRTRNTYQTRSSNARRSTRRNPAKNVGKIIAILVVLMGILPSVLGVLFNIVGSQVVNESFWEEEYIYSDFVEYTYEQYMEPGFYTVGVHIPEAVYDIEVVHGEYGDLEIFEYVGEELCSVDYYYLDTEMGMEAYGVELLEGQILEVSSELQVVARTYDDSDYDLLCEYNILEMSYHISDTVVAGVDFPAGVYDIYYAASFEDEFGNVTISLWNDELQTFMLEEYVYFDSYMGETYFRNVPLTKGTEVFVNDLKGVSLIPSETVDPNRMYLFE